MATRTAAITTVSAQRPRFPFKISRVLFLTVAVIFTILALTPFILTVSGSVKTKSEILDWPPTISPTVIQWQNYVDVWTNSHFFPQWILNSVWLAVFHLVVYIAICSLAGYAFARMNFPGATVFFIAILGSIMVPGQVLWVPKFLILNQLGLVDNWLGVGLPDLAEVFGVFFMTQFFKSLPKELEEAASIDGAGTFRTFRQIILPNAYPALAALVILRFQGSWNEFQWPLIVLRSPDHLTLPLGLASFQGLFGVNWNWVLAGAMFNALPIILLVIFFQKYFIRSAASSAVKG